MSKPYMPYRLFSAPHTPTRVPHTVWMRGTVAEKLSYCQRQAALLSKWFGETADVVFLIQIDLWMERIRNINAGKL